MLQSFPQPHKFWRRSKHQKLKNSTVTSKKTGCGLYLWSQLCAHFTTGKEICSLWVGSSLGDNTSNTWCIAYRQLHWIINSDYETLSWDLPYPLNASTSHWKSLCFCGFYTVSDLNKKNENWTYNPLQVWPNHIEHHEAARKHNTSHIRLPVDRSIEQSIQM